MKQLLSILLVVTLMLGGMCQSALASDESPDESGEPIIKSFYQEGVELSIPEELFALGACEAESSVSMDEYYRPEVAVSLYSPALRNLIDELIMAVNDETSTEEEVMAINDAALKLYKQMLIVRLYTEEEYEEMMAEGLTLEDIVGVDNAEELGVQEGNVYVAFEPEIDTTDLDEETAGLYTACLEYIPAVRESLKLIPVRPEGAIDDTVPAFSATDLDGNPVTNDVFRGKTVTMINIWATFCGPCIDEMPDLGELSRSLPEDAQIIGLVIDIDGDTNLQLAKDIVSGSNADFTHIIANETLLTYTDGIMGVPTSIFVDENGNQIGEPVLGSRSEEEYRAIIEELLE